MARKLILNNGAIRPTGLLFDNMEYINYDIYHSFHTHGTICFGYNNSERVVINTDYETKVHQFKQT